MTGDYPKIISSPGGHDFYYSNKIGQIADAMIIDCEINDAVHTTAIIQIKLDKCRG